MVLYYTTAEKNSKNLQEGFILKILVLTSFSSNRKKKCPSIKISFNSILPEQKEISYNIFQAFVNAEIKLDFQESQYAQKLL